MRVIIIIKQKTYKLRTTKPERGYDNKMKIVITDCKTVTNGDIDLSVFEKYGQVTALPLTPYDEVADVVRDADIILCNKTLLNSFTLRKADKLKYIGLFATGYNNIDLPYCKEKNITVCNAGGYSTEAVAQHTFAFILEHYSKISKYNNFVQCGGWKKSEIFSPFVYNTSELCGKTIGLVGFGTIAACVAKIALAFGMRVLAYSRSKKSFDGVEFTALDTLLKQSDIVSVHCPLNKESEKMFNENSFNKFKRGSYFINTARGGVVDEKALANAVLSGHLSGAAIDVLDPEPMAQSCALFGIENITITPHVAWAPIETRRRLIDIVCGNIEAFLSGKPQNTIVP